MLEHRPTGDGSYSLYSTTFREGFHSRRGALAEARQKFVGPAELERFPPGRELWVVEVAVGTGTNTAALIEATGKAGLRLRWWGLELDPAPLSLALADPGFRSQWPAAVLERLQELGRGPEMLWGDGRRRIADLPATAAGRCDLVLLDAFSPRRCPQLWSVEFLGALARLLAPEGRLLTYCSAAAVRRGLQLAGLQLASIRSSGSDGRQWCLGTVASPAPLPPSPHLRALGRMEREHLQTRAAEPYRDPTGCASAEEILRQRASSQATSTAASSGDWRRRWGIAVAAAAGALTLGEEGDRR